MATQFNFDTTPFSFSDSSGPSNPMLQEVPILGQSEFGTPLFGQDEFLGGLGLGGATFAAQTGRLPTTIPSGNLSPFAQRVAANDAARLARANFGSQTLGNLPPRGSLSPATGPSGGTTLPSQPSLSQARNAAARSVGTNLGNISKLARFGGPAATLLGLADLGSRAFTGKGIGELGGELLGNVIYPGAQSLPAAFDAETLEELAAEGGVPFNPYEFRQDNFSGPVSLNSNTFGGFSLPNSFRPPSAGAIPNEEDPFINPITLQSLGLESGPQEVLRTGQLPVQEEVIDEFSPASNLFSFESAAEVNPFLRDVDLGSFAPTIEDSQSLPQSLPQTLSQFIRYEDDPSKRTEQFVDEQGRLRRRLTPEAAILQGFAPDSEVLAPEYSGIEQASADRLARLGARDFLPGETAVQRDTRLANAETAGSDNVPLDVIEAINTPSNRRTKDQIKRISQWESSEQGKAMGGISGLVQERTQFEPRVVEIDGQRLIQLSPTYYQPIRSEPAEGEKFEPRVRQDGDFVYYEIAPNRFERQPSANFTSQQDLLNKLSELEEYKQLGVTLNEKNISSFTQKQEEDIQKVMAASPGESREDVIKAMQGIDYFNN